jgi:hypothetical protein
MSVQKKYAPQVHVLKEWPVFFAELAVKIRTFEIRLNDRNYMRDDVLVIKEYMPDGDGGNYTGRQVHRTIRAVFNHEKLPGLMPGFVAIQLSNSFTD